MINHRKLHRAAVGTLVAIVAAAAVGTSLVLLWIMVPGSMVRTGPVRTPPATSPMYGASGGRPPMAVTK